MHIKRDISYWNIYSKVVSSYLQLTTYSKLHNLLLIKTFYPASYLIEENNQLPDPHTIAH